MSVSVFAWKVMQHPTDGAQILGLHSNQKDASVRAAELSVHSLSSQPVEQEDVCSHHGNKTKASGRRTEVDILEAEHKTNKHTKTMQLTELWSKE